MASTEQKKCEFLLQGDLNQCKLKHILNSSTGICVDKESMLGKHLTKIQNNTQEVVKIVEKQNNKELLEHLKSLKDEITESLKRIDTNQENLKYSIQEFKDELKEELYEIKNILHDLKETKNKNVLNELETLEKHVEKCNEEISDIKSCMENLNMVEEKLQGSKSGEEQRVIELLKDEYNIVSSSSKDNPINAKIKNFLIYVRGNIEKGKKTMVTKELIHQYF